MAIPTTVIRNTTYGTPNRPTTVISRTTYPNRGQANLLAPGVQAPYKIVRPPSVPSTGQWAGSTSPGAGWTGLGAGWWAPPAGGSSHAQPQSPSTSGTTVTPPPAAAPPAAPAASPLDSTYSGNVTASQAQTGNQIAGYVRQQGDADTALQTTLAGYAHQQPLDVLAAQIAANRTGGLFSTSLGQHLGGIDYDYTQRRGAAQTTHDTTLSNLADAIAAAQGTENIYESGQYGDAVTRASQAAQKNVALGMPTTPLVNDQYLIKGGAAAPAYTLTPPKSAPKGAKWSGGAKPPGNWRGIGGGWWVPK